VVVIVVHARNNFCIYIYLFIYFFNNLCNYFMNMVKDYATLHHFVNDSSHCDIMRLHHASAVGEREERVSTHVHVCVCVCFSSKRELTHVTCVRVLFTINHRGYCTPVCRGTPKEYLW
jgi:hypothetical protein